MINIRLKGTSQIADHSLWPNFSNKAKYGLIDIEMWFFVENGKDIGCVEYFDVIKSYSLN